MGSSGFYTRPGDSAGPFGSCPKNHKLPMVGKRMMTFWDKIAAEIKAAEDKAAADPRFYDGSDWWELRGEEAFVLGIDPARWPRMMTAWQYYDVFMGQVGGEEYGLADEA